MSSTNKSDQKPAPVIKPCFPYPGGKTRFLKHILPLIPSHRTYVEPFAGGLAVLLAKPRSPMEAINDLNGDVVNFYLHVKWHKDALLEELGASINARTLFSKLLDWKPQTDLQRAARWFLLRVNSFGGMSGTWGRGKAQYHGYDRKRHAAIISAVSERLNRVLIENSDWESVVQFFDGPDTFFFFDPPYVAAGKTAYDPFPEFEMERVRARLDQLQGQWILTCDNSPQCRRIFEGYEYDSLSIKYTTSLTVGKPMKLSQEMLVLSPGIAAARKAA